jgi:phospholipase/carboxylesterase|tara:strand:- start:2291 stop:2947 length:657 start_codon:yes stop_codon:yes gene_type:complete
MNLSLDTKIIEPEGSKKIKNAIILLHGYGGDGNDISLMTLNWKRFLPDTVFLCPNGHQKCEINSKGYQWFDLTKDDPEYILKETLKAEKIIKNYIEEVKSIYNLNNSNLCISGFSQGCMMSINLGLTSDEKFNCIVGFSGKIINKENLAQRIKVNSKILLLHGDSDQVVPSHYLLEAKDFLLRKKIEVEAKIIKNCDHHIPIEASSFALNYIKKNFNI